jgi:two-component system response regulator MprA
MSGRSVLLIDDDVDIVATVRMILQRDGWDVTAAGDGAEGLAVLRGGLRPNVILLDLMMPGVNGWEFCDAVRADPELQGVPVVVVSGAGDVDEKAAAVGAVGHLRKPFELSALREVVRIYGAPRPEPSAPRS